jgi:hypothetical protein
LAAARYPRRQVDPVTGIRPDLGENRKVTM